MENGQQDLSLEVLRATPPEGVSPHNVPLLFIHGAFAGAWCWAESFLPVFAGQGWSSTAFSFRGHGQSAGRQALHEFGIEDYVRDLESLIEDFEHPPVLIGHSMGGFVAMRYLEAHGASRVSGLALLASVPPAGLWGPSLSMMTFQPSLFMALGQMQIGEASAQNLDTLKRALFTPQTPDEKVRPYQALMNGESQRAVLDLHTTARVDPGLVRGPLPICVMGGEKDALIPPAYVRTTGRQLDSGATILPNVGHGMMLGENAPPTAGHLVKWLLEEGLT